MRGWFPGTWTSITYLRMCIRGTNAYFPDLHDVGIQFPSLTALEIDANHIRVPPVLVVGGDCFPNLERLVLSLVQSIDQAEIARPVDFLDIRLDAVDKVHVGHNGSVQMLISDAFAPRWTGPSPVWTMGTSHPPRCYPNEVYALLDLMWDLEVPSHHVCKTTASLGVVLRRFFLVLGKSDAGHVHPSPGYAEGCTRVHDITFQYPSDAELDVARQEACVFLEWQNSGTDALFKRVRPIFVRSRDSPSRRYRVRISWIEDEEHLLKLSMRVDTDPETPEEFAASTLM